MSDDLPLELAQIDAFVAHGRDEAEPLRQLSAQRLRREFGATGIDDEAQALANLLQREHLAVGIDELLQKVDSIAEAAGSAARDGLKRVRRHLEFLLPGDVAQPRHAGGEGDAAEIEALAARDDGGRHLVHFRGG